MSIDINLKFPGFHGSAGKCHVRFCKLADEKPLAIICSQYINYYGTSNTNAHEAIAETIFYLVANQKIENVSFDFELPVFNEWHDDVNIFDKALTKLFPLKYGPRFISKKLDIREIYRNIIFIEHYSNRS